MAMNSDRLPLENKKTQNVDSLYLKNQRKSRIFLVMLVVVLLLSMVLSLWAGSYETPVVELIRGIFGKASDEKINIVVRNVRLPRICTAVAAGAGLGVTGCILQAILNNPLASSSTLGVSQGAGFGAAFAIIVLGAGISGSGIGVSLCAFIGSMAVAAVIFALSKFKQVSAESIVLAGVAISSMFTGATTLLQYFADEVELATLVFWTFGDLGSTDWGEIRFMSVIVLAAFLYFLFHRWDYNALQSGTETAVSLGIRSGFVMGEGAGALVLEEYEHAVSRGAKIYAEIAGYGCTCDAYHVTAPHPEAEGGARAIRDAVEETGMQEETRVYINAHGTSTPLNDKAETVAIKKAYGEKAKQVLVSSTKSMTGHMLGAAGAAAAIAAVLALREGIVPPTIGLNEPDPECDLDYVPHTARQADLALALSVSLGFGGHNACVAFKKV